MLHFDLNSSTAKDIFRRLTQNSTPIVCVSSDNSDTEKQRIHKQRCPRSKVRNLQTGRTMLSSKKRKSTNEDRGASPPKKSKRTEAPRAETSEEQAREESESEDGQNPATATTEEPQSFADLGIIPELAEACAKMGYKAPTPIQAQSIPLALAGKDVIGLAETGSGKTAAFGLPILQALLANPSPNFALVLAPTRELAYQISQQFEALGSIINVRCATIVGGMDMVAQSIALSKKPHIIVATPGRLLDHLETVRTCQE